MTVLYDCVIRNSLYEFEFEFELIAERIDLFIFLRRKKNNDKYM